MKSIFEVEIRLSFEYLKAMKRLWFMKIPDAPPIKKNFYSIRKPFDFIAITDNYKYAIECKMIRVPRLNLIPEHQENGLMEFSKLRRASSYIFVNYRTKKVNEAYAIPIQAYLGMKRRNSSRKSIPIGDIRANFMVDELERIKDNGKYFWYIPIIA